MYIVVVSKVRFADTNIILSSKNKDNRINTYYCNSRLLKAIHIPHSASKSLHSSTLGIFN